MIYKSYMNKYIKNTPSFISTTESIESKESSKECSICNEYQSETEFSTCPHCSQHICDKCTRKIEQCPFCRGEFGLWKCLFCKDWFILDERIKYHFCLNDYPECIHQFRHPFIPGYLCVRKSHYGRIIERIWMNIDQEIVEYCNCDLEIFG